METVVDWAVKPEPCRWIGPQFRAECEGIATGEPRAERPGEAVRRRRKALGLSQAQLGALAQMPQSNVSDVELGRLVGASTIARLEAALDRAEQGDR